MIAAAAAANPRERPTDGSEIEIPVSTAPVASEINAATPTIAPTIKNVDRPIATKVNQCRP